MYKISDEFNRRAFADDRDVSVLLYFNDDIEIPMENIIELEIEESLSSSESLSIGDVCSNRATIKFKMPEESFQLKGSKVSVHIGLLQKDGGAYCPMGVYYVDEVNSNDNFKTVEVVAYDGMSKLDMPYETSYEGSFSVDAALEELVQKYPDIITLKLVDMPISPVRMVTAYDCTVREMLGYIAGLYGRNARFDRNGELEFAWYGVATEEIPQKAIYMNGITNLAESDFVSDKLISGTQENPLIVGNPEGTPITFYNPFMTKSILASIWYDSGFRQFRPMTVKYRCNPCYECGDLFYVDGHTTMIMSQKIKVAGGMSATFSCYGASDDGISNRTNIKDEINTIVGKASLKLEESFKNATALLKGEQGGYFHILSDEQGFPIGWEIRDSQSVTSTTKLWRMTSAGLGYSSNGGRTFAHMAITMDGGISADSITAGTLNCSAVKLSGALSGWSMEDSRLWCEIRPPYDYTADDVTKIQRYIIGHIDLTDDELVKYDVNKDGEVTSADAVYVQRLINARLSHSRPGKIVLDASDWLYPIKIVDANNKVLSAFGSEGVSTFDIGSPSDVVVEEGTHDGLNYQKWSSGKIEVWGKYYGELPATTQLSANAHRSILTIPLGEILEEVYGGFCGYLSTDVQPTVTAHGTEISRAQLGYISTTPKSAILDTFPVYIIGRWK